MFPRDKNAFTLIELLVVIAIISVLAALLLPALRGALAASRSVQCINNEKQLYLAINLYADSWGVYPAKASYPDTSPVFYHYWWSALLEEDLIPSTKESFYCPEKIPFITRASRVNYPHSDYAINERAFIKDGSWNAGWWTPGKVKHPTEMYLLGERQKIWIGSPTYGDWRAGGSNLNTDGNNLDRNAHREMYTNMTYFDGHIEVLLGYDAEALGAYTYSLPWFNK